MRSFPRGNATTTSGFIRTHALLAYFVLTFAISWGGVLIVVAPGGIPATAERFKALVPFAVLAMLVGPSVAGIVLTGVVDGRTGLRELLSRLLEWRVGARWYAAALLTAPLVTAAVFLVLRFFSPAFLPGILTIDDKPSRIVFGIAAAVGAGIFEELGWTGFVVPRLRLRYGILATGGMLGVLWSAWHVLVGFWSSATYVGGVPVAVFLVTGLFTTLTVFRVLMVWVYDRTGSLLIAMLMHASLTACTIILNPLTTGMPLLTYDLVMAAALWVVVAAVGIANGENKGSDS